MSQKINYIGWLGYRNLGDESLYTAIRRFFPGYTLVPYTLSPRIQRLTPSRYASRITLLGGGTLLPNWIRIIRPNKYIYIFGSGVRDPSFWGETDRVTIKRLKSYNIRFLGVRGNISKAILDGWGVPSEVIGDPVLSMDGHALKRIPNRVVINIGSDGQLWGNDEQRVLREIREVVRSLTGQDYEVILLPFSIRDVPQIKALAEMEHVGVFKDWLDAQSTLDLIASSRAVIGEKLHSLVFSAATKTPFIGLEYRPKCSDFAESVGFGDYMLRTSGLTAGMILDRFTSLLDNWKSLSRTLAGRVAYYRGRQLQAAERIKADIEQLPPDKWSAPPPPRYRLCWEIDNFFLRHSHTMWKAWNRCVMSPITHYSV